MRSRSWLEDYAYTDVLGLKEVFVQGRCWPVEDDSIYLFCGGVNAFEEVAVDSSDSRTVRKPKRR